MLNRVQGKNEIQAGSSWHPDRLQAASGPGLLGFMARPAARDASCVVVCI